MWEGGVGGSEFNKRLSQAPNEEKFQISTALKEALKVEISRWLTDDKWLVVMLLRGGIDSFEKSVNEFMKLRYGEWLE